MFGAIFERYVMLCSPGLDAHQKKTPCECFLDEMVAVVL